MAIAAPELAEMAAGGAGGGLSADEATEYKGLTDKGAPPGHETMQRARKNLAARKAAQSADKQRQQPSKPAPSSKPAAAPATRSSSSSRPRSSSSRSSRSSNPAVSVYNALPGGSSSSALTSGFTKLIWAGAIGLLALEVLSYVTGQYFNWNLGGVLANPLKSAKTTAYVPLYTPPPPYAGSPSVSSPDTAAKPATADVPAGTNLNPGDLTGAFNG